MENNMEEKCLFEIRSGMYTEPLKTLGTMSTEGNRTIYKWTEKHSEQEQETHFMLTLIKEESKILRTTSRRTRKLKWSYRRNLFRTQCCKSI